MHFYRFHVADYMSHTRHLSRMEDLAYRRMLDHAYLHERGLAGDAEAVARIIDLRDLVDEVAAILREFWFQDAEGVWRNHRVEKELALMADKQAKAVAAGRASANARSKGVQRTFNGRSTDGQHESNGRPTIRDSKTPRHQDASTLSPASLPVASLPFMNEGEPEPAEKPKKPKAALIEAVVADTAFQRFWTAYDLKKGRDEAAKSWGRIAPDQQLAEAIVAAARWYAEDNPDKAFRKHPATWLNQKGWLDERVSKGGANAKPQDGGFDNFGRWKGVPRGKVDYSVGLGEDDPEHPKQLLANENGIRASRSLPPLTMDEWKAMGDPRATQGTFTRNTP